jgi:peptidyl-dipeptidase Dcp
VWAPARSAAIAEYEELSNIARAAGIETVEGWDWRFFAEQVKTARYALSDDEVMAYFTLDGVLNAAFDCANRLFGLTFVERFDVHTYHPDVRVFEFHEHGSLRGVFLSDNFARNTKRSGAWMSTYRSRAEYLEGFEGLPVVANHNNFAKGSLLSSDDARTLFHEFGHGLHAMLSESPYQRLGGVQVLRDFVELPSQLFEHWITEPEVLKKHARHHETSEPIPDELLERMKRAQYFNQGFDTVEYVVSALFDQAVHAQTEPIDIGEFEKKQLAELGMPPAMVMRHRPTQFQHLFASSGYAAAYYVYLWAEVLDADAYNAFIEAGSPFDPATANRLRTYIYSSGNTIEPGQAYRNFRGRDAGITPLLKGRGLA